MEVVYPTHWSDLGALPPSGSPRQLISFVISGHAATTTCLGAHRVRETTCRPRLVSKFMPRSELDRSRRLDGLPTADQILCRQNSRSKEFVQAGCYTSTASGIEFQAENPEACMASCQHGILTLSRGPLWARVGIRRRDAWCGTSGISALSAWEISNQRDSFAMRFGDGVEAKVGMGREDGTTVDWL